MGTTTKYTVIVYRLADDGRWISVTGIQTRYTAQKDVN